MSYLGSCTSASRASRGGGGARRCVRVRASRAREATEAEEERGATRAERSGMEQREMRAGIRGPCLARRCYLSLSAVVSRWRSLRATETPSAEADSGDSA